MIPHRTSHTQYVEIPRRTWFYELDYIVCTSTLWLKTRTRESTLQSLGLTIFKVTYPCISQSDSLTDANLHLAEGSVRVVLIPSTLYFSTDLNPPQVECLPLKEKV